MSTLVMLAFTACILGSLLAAAALGSVRKAKLPRYRRLRGFLMGVGLGGIVSGFLLCLAAPWIIMLSFRLGDRLAKHGYGEDFLGWLLLYCNSGAMFAGMAAGAGIAWWIMRERAK
jgi:hypothetical protein